MIQATQLSVGLDIGGTKTEALVVDQAGCVLGQSTQPTNITHPDNLLEGVSQTVQEALDKANVTPQHICSIGVGIPGKVNPQTGIVQLAVNLNLKEYPLGSALSARFKAPTLLENDVRTAAIGAYEFFRRKEPIQHMAYLSVGTGIAAGLIINGRLYRGYNGMAGEIGHMIIDPNGNRCNCGLVGCLETIVSGPAIIQQMKMADTNAKATFSHAGDIYRAAKAGNPAAQKVVQNVSFYLSRAIQWLIMTYDIEKIGIGGGVSHTGQDFLDPVLLELAKLRQQSSLAAKLLLNKKLCLMPPEYNAGVWGAVHLARQII